MPHETDLDDEYEPGPRQTKRSKHMGGEDLHDWENRHRKVMPQHRDKDSPWTQRLVGDLTNDAEMVHEMTRTEQAQNADESFNAPIADTYNQWLENPNRYDLPGVDTIPDERRRQRAGRVAAAARHLGAVDDIVIGDPDRSAHQPAKFSGRGRGDTILETSIHLADEGTMDQVRERDLDTAWNTLGPYLAHELGHAFDHFYGEGGYEKVGYASDEYITEENREAFKRASLRLRGDRSQPDYQFSNNELAADAFALYTLEPRALRREEPEVYETVDREVGRPLEASTAGLGLRDLEDDI